MRSTGGRARSRSFVAAVLLALACAGTAAAADVGANDDTGKFAPDAGAAFYGEMASLGLRQTVVTVRWLPSDPLALGERPLLDLTVAAARAAGLSVVFATYPYPTREVEAGLARPEAFGAWLGELAQRYPTVRQFVVGNEPNQPAFWRPQFSGAKQRSAAHVRPVPRRGVRRVEGSRPDADGSRGRSLATRERSPHRQEQRLDVTRPLPRIPRRLVPGERPWRARSWTASASTPTRTPRPIRSTAAIRGRTRASSTSPGSSRPRGMRSPAPLSRRRSTGSVSISTRSAGRSTPPAAPGTRAPRTSR